MASVDNICDGSGFFEIYMEIMTWCLPKFGDHVHHLFQLRWVMPAKQAHEIPDVLHNHPLVQNAYTSNAKTSLKSTLEPWLDSSYQFSDFPVVGITVNWNTQKMSPYSAEGGRFPSS